MCIMTTGLADLHRHIDGSLRMQTVLELANERGLDLPQPFGFSPNMGLEQALAQFAFTLRLLDTEEALERVAGEICEDATAEGVTTLELRFAPQLHGRGLAGVDDFVDATLRGIDGRAGLLLCGLYGESPEVLETLVECAAERPGVVGIDLAGGPLPGHGHGMADYRAAFVRAGELGLGRTVHAGEGRPPAEIRAAVETLCADRLGHATTILRDPAVVELVRERGLTIEACITSNMQVGAIASCAAHPLPRWIESGLKVCICTDNTLLSATTLPAELEVALGIEGVDQEMIEQTIAFAHAAAFTRTGRSEHPHEV